MLLVVVWQQKGNKNCSKWAIGNTAIGDGSSEQRVLAAQASVTHRCHLRGAHQLFVHVIVAVSTEEGGRWARGARSGRQARRGEEEEEEFRLSRIVRRLSCVNASSRKCSLADPVWPGPTKGVGGCHVKPSRGDPRTNLPASSLPHCLTACLPACRFCLCPCPALSPRSSVASIDPLDKGTDHQFTSHQETIHCTERPRR